MTTAPETVTATEPTSWEPPGWVHFSTALTIHRPGTVTAVYAYGDELFVDDALLDANRDRHGECALLHRIRRGLGVHPGRWPEGQNRLLEGSLAWLDARENARRAAHAIHDEDERRIALAKFRAEWGDLATSRTLSVMKGDDERD